MEHADVTSSSKTMSNQSSEKDVSAEASAAVRGLAEIFACSKGHGGYRRYALERIDSELVFRQTEIDAAIEAALAKVFGSGRKTGGHRRVIKLPVGADE
jgi:hypothetical protein